MVTTITDGQQFTVLRPSTADGQMTETTPPSSTTITDTTFHITLPNMIPDTTTTMSLPPAIATSATKFVHQQAKASSVDSRHILTDTPPNLSRKPTLVSQHRSSQYTHQSTQPDLSRAPTTASSNNDHPPPMHRALSSYDGADMLSPIHSVRTIIDINKPVSAKRISVQSVEHTGNQRTPTNKHRRMLSTQRSMWRSNTAMTDDDASAEAEEMPPNIIHPNTYWLPAWDTLILLNILYQAMIVPFTISFWPLYNSVDSTAEIVITILNCVTDIVFIMDVFIRFRLAIIEHSVLVTDPKNIAQQYMRTWFALDLIAALPIDLVQIGLLSVVPVLRVNKLVRLVKTFSLFNKFESNTSNSATRAFVIRLIKLLFYTCLFSHIVACIKYHVMLDQITQEDVYPDPATAELLHRSYFSRYLQALYWATGAITGRDDTNPPTTFTDTLFTVLMMVIGMLWFAYIVASLESFIDNNVDVEHAFQSRLKFINKFMKSYNIPAKTQEQVKAYYSYLWSSSLRYDSNQLVNALPVSLKAELYYELYGQLLAQCELFQHTHAPNGLLALLASKLTVSTVIPNEIICSANTTGDCMWFIQQGEVEILVGTKMHDGSNGKSIATLRKGDYFGEYSIFVSKYRTSTAKAVSYCTLLQLSTVDMLTSLQLYTGSEQAVRSHVAEHRQRTKQQESNLLGLDASNGNDVESVRTLNRNAKLKRLIQVETDDNKAKVKVSWTFSGSAVWYQLFLCLYITATLYNTIIIPVRFAFDLNESYYLALDYVSDSVYIADMLLHTRLRYIDKGVEVTDIKVLAKRYVRSWLILHCLSILPFDLLMLIPSVGLTSIVRVNRVLRLFHVNQLLLHRIKHHINHEIISLVYFIFCVLLLSHWSACTYWTLATWEGYAEDNYEWRPPASLESSTLIFQYLRAQYYSMSLLAGIGRHNMPPTDLDVLFTLLLMLTGVFLISYIIGKVGYLVLHLNASVQQQKNDLTYYTQHMRYNELSDSLCQRVQTYFTHKWTIQHGVDPNIALSELPYSLRADIMFYLCETLIKSVPKFKYLDNSFVRALAAELTFLELPDNEYVFRQGFTGNCIYFVGNGLVELVVDKPVHASHDTGGTDSTHNNRHEETTEVILKVLGTGSFFGEGALFSGKRSTSARTKSNCQLLLLSNESFKRIVQLNVSFASVMQKLNADRQAKVNVALGVEVKMDSAADMSGALDSPNSGANAGRKQRNALRQAARQSLEPVGRLQAARSMAQQRQLDLSAQSNRRNMLQIDTQHQAMDDDVNLLSPARQNNMHVSSPSPFTPNSANRALFEHDDTTGDIRDTPIKVLQDDTSNSIASIIKNAAHGNGQRTAVIRRPLKLNDSMSHQLNTTQPTVMRGSVSTPDLTAVDQAVDRVSVPATATDAEHSTSAHNRQHSLSKIV